MTSIIRLTNIEEVDKAIASLFPIHRLILSYTYGIGLPVLSPKKIASKLKISIFMVNHLETEAIQNLIGYFRKHGIPEELEKYPITKLFKDFKYIKKHKNIY